MKAEKPIKTETGIFTKVNIKNSNFWVYDKNGESIGKITITDYGFGSDELMELEEIILSIGVKK